MTDEKKSDDAAFTSEQEGLPEELRARPTAHLPAPPVDTAAQRLPFQELTWENFEALCAALALLDGNPERTRRYGTQGQRQQGIDIYSRLNDGSYVTYQCKKWAAITAADIVDAVDKFLAGGWSAKSHRFVFCTSHSLLPTKLADEIETQTDRLKELGISFVPWDSEALSGRLKSHPGIVEDFFGTDWLKRFSRPERFRELSGDQPRSALAAGDLASSMSDSLRIISFEWAPRRVQEGLEELREGSPDVFVSLNEAIGVPPDGGEIAELVTAPPPWLADGDWRLWRLVALIAEKAGAWRAARDAWKGAAAREPDDPVALLCSAAACAGIEEDRGSKEKLLDRARSIDPTHPRIALAEIDQGAPGPERIDLLSRIEARDDDTRIHLAAHRALAALLVPDLDLAAEELEVLTGLAPDGATTQAVAINLTVQRGRIMRVAGMPLDANGLAEAGDKALRLRDALLEQKRFEESGRLLMLAADSAALMDERTRAADLIREADPAELAAPEIREVLASAAAGRALDFRLGLELIEPAPDSPEKRLIEAECLEEVGTPDQREAALRTLEEIVSEGGSHAAEAAFVRLAATLGGRPTAWSKPAADFLCQNGHERAAVTVEVFYVIRRHSDYARAEELLKPHMSELWAKAAWLRMEITRGNWPKMKDAADVVMESGPSQSLRLDAGRAYARSRNHGRAKEVLIALGRDGNAAVAQRSEAYRLLMMVVGDELQEWRLAGKLHREWVEIDPGSPEASAIAVRIASRRRSAAD
jgi:hypothetical protein